jgi:hypothetical protein
MGRYGNIDYPTLTKRAFLFGLCLFAFGAGGEFVVHSYLGPVPAWEETLLLDLEVIGVLVALLSPFVFGVALPLTE